MAGCSTWAFFFSVAGAVFLLYLFFVAGVAHHAHIHINRTLANFFPDTLLTSGGFRPKPIYGTNFAFFLVFFILGFAHGTHHFPRKYFQTFWQPPPSRPQNAIKFMNRTPQNICEIHPKISYNQFCIII